MVLGALEAGGTKMVCAVGDECGNIFDEITIATESPEVTMPQMVSFYKGYDLDALGIGSFGPINLDKTSREYGVITTSPKVEWRNYNIYQTFSKELGCPIGLDTDVNAACLGEMHYGKAKGCSNVIYITIGTGVGVGICAEGKLLHGVLHPEAGHMLIKRLPEDSYSGTCPFHGDCLEGLVSGGAIGGRYGVKAETISKEDIAWDYTAYYIAEAVSNLILTLAPEKIILGGGVMKQEQLIEMIVHNVNEILHGYITTKQMQTTQKYIVTPGCNGKQGVLGALILAKEQL